MRLLWLHTNDEHMRAKLLVLHIMRMHIGMHDIYNAATALGHVPKCCCFIRGPLFVKHAQRCQPGWERHRREIASTKPAERIVPEYIWF